MPRVHTQVKSTRGRDRACDKCGTPILPGDRYMTWEFRYGGQRFRCMEHPPRQSDLTQSRMSEIYAEIESAQDELPNVTTVEEVVTLVENVAAAVREVAEAYTEAAEPFGGAGENAERAEQLEGWADELDGFSPDDEDDEDASEEEREAAVRLVVSEVCAEENVDFGDLDAVIAVFMIDEGIMNEKIGELREESGEASEALTTARDEATDLLGGCPL